MSPNTIKRGLRINATTAAASVALAAASIFPAPAGVVRAAPETNITVQPPCDTAAFDAAWASIQTGLGGTLTFNCGEAPVSINMSGTKTITKQVTIDGGGKVLLNGNFITRHFVVNAGAALTLTNITIAGGGGGFSLDAGGAVQNFGTLTVLTSTFHTNQTGSNYGGGAIYSRGRLLIDNSVFRNNAAGSGGAIFNERVAGSAGKASIDNSQILSNTAKAGFGAGLYSAGELWLYRVLIEANGFGATAANGHGGAGLANLDPGLAILDYVTIRGNSVGEDAEGGAGVLNTGTLAFADGSVVQNVARGRLPTTAGGGIYNTGTMNLDYVFIGSNSAGVGGGIYDGNRSGDSKDNFTLLQGVSVDDNSASSSAGIHCVRCVMLIDNTTISRNSASNGGGGGVGMVSAILLEMKNTTIAKNKAHYNGGGIEADGGVLTLQNVTLAENAAETGPGGGLSLADSLSGSSVTATLVSTIVANSTMGGNCAVTGVLNASSSLSSDNTCAFVGMNNQLNTDPMLNLLGDYGGSKLTYLPKAGSPAIDGVIGSNAPAIDQRGLPRPVGAGYDIGAVERQLDDGARELTKRVRLPLVVR